MLRRTLQAAGFGVLALAGGAASSATAHTVDDAYGKLHRHGYYDIRVQRASEPYSFIACKHGQRYHIHINYYGDFEQVDQVGYCGGYARRYDDDGDGYYRRRPSNYGYYGRRQYYAQPDYDRGYYSYRRARYYNDSY